MPLTTKPDVRFPVKLTQAQRKVVAEIAPELADRLKLDETPQRTLQFTLVELQTIKQKAETAMRRTSKGMVLNSLRHVTGLTTQAIDRSHGILAIPASERVYQFKITLKESQPPIWRRIQIKDCTLDKLHEHIQTAMGWTNAHLHDFRIDDKRYGDPVRLHENFDDMDYEDSTATKISELLPKNGKAFRFGYEYDFGDCWGHEVLFEGCVRAEEGGRYPVCVEGARACPPEDVGGTPGYEEYLEAMADPDHERHEEFMGWHGPFDPEALDPVKATKRMRRGLPDWRSESWI
jgi:Plasmid pRiA4b ORF-3-like protein